MGLIRESGSGILLLGVAVAMTVVGFLWIRRVTETEDGSTFRATMRGGVSRTWSAAYLALLLVVGAVVALVVSRLG